MKKLVWLGNSRVGLLSLPDEARHKIGRQLNTVQHGDDADDWKPFSTVGAGAQEIRVQIDGNQFRSIFVARFEEAVYVLHCFAKKEQQTSAKDIDIAKQRYKMMKTLRASQ